MSKDKNKEEKDKKEKIFIKALKALEVDTGILYGMATEDIKEEEIKPSVLSETPVKVFNGKEEVSLTVLEIDEESMLKMLLKSKNMYDQLRYLIQYRIKEIDDGEEFLNNNSLHYIGNMAEAIYNVDYKRERGTNPKPEDDLFSKMILYEMLKNNLNK